MIADCITFLPGPVFGVERPDEIVIRTLRFTSHHRLDIARMTPKAPNISIVFWYTLLVHLVCVFYAVVARPIRFADALQTCTCGKVPQVACSTDSIPRFRNPQLHSTPYTRAPYQYMDVWRATTLKFEEPQDTNARNTTAQGNKKRIQVSLHVVAIVWKFAWIGQC